jgi:hypothetical protein
MADLTVTTSDTVTLTGRKYGNEHTTTISGVNNVVHAVTVVPNATAFELFGFGNTLQGFSSFVASDLKYLRFTNTDSTHPVFLTLSFTDGVPTAPDGRSNLELPAGCSFVLFAGEHITSSSAAFSLHDMYRIKARATGGDVTMDMFIATA